MANDVDRLGVIEQRVRRLYWLAAGVVVVLLLMLGWIGLTAWSSYRTYKRGVPIPPIAMPGYVITDKDWKPRAVLIGTPGGWMLRSSPENTEPGAIILDSSLKGTSLSFDVVNGTPRLVLTDAEGKEVWRAP